MLQKHGAVCTGRGHRWVDWNTRRDGLKSNAHGLIIDEVRQRSSIGIKLQSDQSWLEWFEWLGQIRTRRTIMP